MFCSSCSPDNFIQASPPLFLHSNKEQFLFMTSFPSQSTELPCFLKGLRFPSNCDPNKSAWSTILYNFSFGLSVTPHGQRPIGQTLQISEQLGEGKQALYRI